MVNVVNQKAGQHMATETSELLDSEMVATRWRELGAALSRLMAWMDSQEVWLNQKGDQELLAVLVHLIALSENESAVREMHKPYVAGQLAQVLAWVESSRFFRLLEIMDRNSPNFVNRFVLALGRVGGEAGVYADLFFERVMVIHRSELLGRVFGGDRTSAIAEAIRTIRDTRA